MSLYSSLGARPPAPTALPAALQTAGKVAGAQTAPASGKVAARLPTVDPVTLQDDIVSLSSIGLQARPVAASTADSAQNFVNGLARNLFGDGTQTASVSYNLFSLKSAPALPASLADGAVAAAGAVDLKRSASFTGAGQIVTTDGQTFDFEVAVRYRAKNEAASGAPFETEVIETPDVLVLTGKPLPAIAFPGSLNDLFKLLSRELRTEVADAGSPVASGELTLRLLRLVDRAALIAPRARADDPDITPAERAKAVASAYSAPAQTSELSQA